MVVQFHFGFIIFLLRIISSEVVAQTTSEIIFPDELHGPVKLNISSLPIQNKEALGYENLAVFVKNEQGEYVSNAIQGQYTQEGNYLIFKPYFPFESGMAYVVKTKNANSDITYTYQSFQIGKKEKVDQAKVVSIYPSSSELPENLLRFYIYFNTPMKKGQALKHVQLIDEEGNIDSHAFMEFKQELWSADGKRLTVLFDPGRIKRGVSTNMLRGPALIKSKRYKLSISDTWEDVYGQKLSIKTTKEIEVLNAYRHHIKVYDWVIDKPEVHSSDTLTIHFDRIIDHALIQSMIQIEDANENLIIGYWEILEKERSIQFIPQQKWQKGNYRIVIDSHLEDVAGNNLQNLLDHVAEAEDNNGLPQQVINFKL